ncbi:MAG: tetratricopeptide repeat protein [Treponematales bacterium]
MEAQMKSNLGEAVACYTRALELDPDCAEARLKRAMLLQVLKRLDEAEADYTWLIERDGADREARSRRAYVYRLAGRYEEGIADFNRLLEREPDRTEYLGGRGHIYLLNEQYEEALADFSRALELEPKNGARLGNIGEVYVRQGRTEEALATYKEAAKIDEDYSCAYQMAGLYTKLGLIPEAMREVKNEFSRDHDWALYDNYPSYDYRSLMRVSRRDDPAEGAAHIASLAAAGFYVDVFDAVSDFYDPLPYTIVRPFVKIWPRLVLFLEHAHEGRTNRRLIRKYSGRLDLRFDTNFDEVMAACVKIYGESLLTPAFWRCFRALRENTAGQPLRRQKTPRALSCSLYIDGQFAAGDIAIIAGDVYTSYTGCHTQPGAGSLHLALLVRALIAEGFWIWDFGPGRTEYKQRLGAVAMTHERYLSLIGKHDGMTPGLPR